MNNEFKTVNELYKRLLPALKYKYREFSKIGYDYITYDDIWNYLKIHEWSKCNNLYLYEMMNDIVDLSIEKVDDFVKENLRITKRKPILKED